VWVQGAKCQEFGWQEFIPGPTPLFSSWLAFLLCLPVVPVFGVPFFRVSISWMATGATALPGTPLRIPDAQVRAMLQVRDCSQSEYNHLLLVASLTAVTLVIKQS
jgi:hypothetical protein